MPAYQKLIAKNITEIIADWKLIKDKLAKIDFNDPEASSYDIHKQLTELATTRANIYNLSKDTLDLYGDMYATYD